MNETLVVDGGSVDAQIEQITSWLNGHLQNSHHDSDFLIIKLNGTTTYRIINSERAIGLFKKSVRQLRYVSSSGKASNKYSDVRRLRPQGVKFWAKEIAALQDPKSKGEYTGISEEDRAELIAMATKNIEIIQNQGKEAK